MSAQVHKIKFEPFIGVFTTNGKFYDMRNKFFYSKIYCLVNKLNGEIFYIGSTYGNLKKRLSDHIYNSKCSLKRNKMKRSQYIKNVGEHNISIFKLLDYPCKNKIELFKKEKKFIDLIKPCCNDSTPILEEEEKKIKRKNYYQLNKEKESERKKKYYQDNKEKYSKKEKCSCGEIISHGNIQRHFKSKLHCDIMRMNELD